MISRRSLLAGLLASVTLPRLPIPQRSIAYIVFEDIPLERFGGCFVLDDPWVKTPIGWALNSAAKGELVHVKLGGNSR